MKPIRLFRCRCKCLVVRFYTSRCVIRCFMLIGFQSFNILAPDCLWVLQTSSHCSCQYARRYSFLCIPYFRLQYHLLLVSRRHRQGLSNLLLIASIACRILHAPLEVFSLSIFSPIWLSWPCKASSARWVCSARISTARFVLLRSSCQT